MIKDFIYSYPAKVYFGEKAAAKALPASFGMYTVTWRRLKKKETVEE